MLSGYPAPVAPPAGRAWQGFARGCSANPGLNMPCVSADRRSISGWKLRRFAGVEFVGMICGAAVVSLALESRSTWGKRITSPLLSFFLGWMLKSLKLVPPMHPAYDCLASRLLPAALPLMVLSAQVRPMQRSNSKDRHFFLMLVTFALCSFASCAGAIVAFTLHKQCDLPPHIVSKVCGCLTATYIGGSANLAEVAWSSGLAQEQGILACLAAADVMLMCFYFAGLMIVANAYQLGRQPSVLSTGELDGNRSFMDDVKAWLLHIPMAILALLLAFLASTWASDLHLPAASSAVAVGLAAAVAQLGRRRMSVAKRRAVARSTSYMATLFLGCFYTTLGVGAGSGMAGASIFLLSTVVLLGHLFFAFLACELVNLLCGRRLIQLPIFLVASNAAVGGPSTASTFAESLHLTHLVVPAAVCGTVGYALGSPIAIVLMHFFSAYT